MKDTDKENMRSTGSISRVNDINIAGNMQKRALFNIPLSLTKILLIMLIAPIFAQALSDDSNLNNSGLILSNLDNNLSFSNLSFSLSNAPHNNLIIGLKDVSKHGIDFTDNYDLFISTKSDDGSSSGNYKYFGSLVFPITYHMNHFGNFTIMLISKYDNMIIAKESYYYDSYIPEIFKVMPQNQSHVNDENESNTTVNISVDIPSYNNTIVNLSDKITNKAICKDLSLTLDKLSYQTGERIDIKVENNNQDLNSGFKPELDIVENENVYKFVGELTNAYFIPIKTGNYKIILKCSEKTEYITFIVTESSKIINDTGKFENNDFNDFLLNNTTSDISNNYTLKKIIIMDSKGKQINKDIRLFKTKTKEIHKSKNNITKAELSNNVLNDKLSNDNISNNDKVFNSDVPINDSSINVISDVATILVAEMTELSLENVQGLESASLRLESLEMKDNETTLFSIEDVPSEAIDIDSGNVLASYAMDLSSINFTNGTFNKIASGKELWKCKEWNFVEQKCYGRWNKIMDIMPGEYYSFEVSPEDPGYAETGLATINTDRSIYKIDEDAKISAVVLDSKGYLVSNASVSIIVTTPDNDTYLFGNAVESGRGIYEIIFTHNDIEGNYTMQVSAYKNSTYLGMIQFVNYTMISTFAVAEDYDFDIIRNVPMTIDPFNEPLYAEIIIIPLNENIANYNFTEIIPSEVMVSDASGALVSSSGNRTLLTWTGLSGNVTLNYTVQPPLVTPNLLIIGRAFIQYIIGSVMYLFEEIRNWFIAVDPTVTRDQGLVVYADRTDDGFIKYRNWTGTALQGEDNSDVDVGNRISWQKVRCMVDYSQCIVVNSDTGNDINFAIFDTDTWSWRNLTELDGSSLDDQKNFDVECESSSGECIIVYEDSTGNNADFMLRTWNGVTLSGATTITVTSGENDDFRWIYLYPKKNSDVIGVALQNQGGGTGGTPAIYAGIWNGTGFGNWQTLTTNGPSQGNERTNYRHFDCAWEGAGTGAGDFICVFGTNGAGQIDAYSFNGTAWSSLGSIYDGPNNEVLEIVLCGQRPSNTFNHSDIGIMMCDAGSDLDGGIWNGTAFSKTLASDDPAENTNAECGPNKDQAHYALNFNCEWEDSGAQGVFMWVDNNNDYLTYGTYLRSTASFSNPSWDSGTQIIADGAGDIRQTDLMANPASDKIFLVYTDGSRDGGCSLWTGASWDGSGCNSATVFETNGPNVGVGWMAFDWFRNPLPQPEITIITPANTLQNHNYTGIINPSSTSIAWDNGTTAQPPTGASAPITGVEFASAEYVKITSSNDVWHTTIISGSPTGRYAYQSFNFSISESTVNMESIKITHEGYATQGTGLSASQFYIYVYNWSSDTYILEKTVYASTVDVISEITITSGFSDLVRNRQLYVLVEGSFAIGTGANARADLHTDYIGIDVENIPMLSQNATVNATAVDDDGVSLCEWRLFNSTGGTNLTRMTNTIGDYYYNISSISTILDGFYTLTVFCNDTTTSRTNTSVYVYIDNTRPAIQLYAPGNGANITANYALFAWNVTDLIYEVLICNVTIDGTVRAANVYSTHGDNTTKNITSISDGTHYWNVTCIDDAGNRNTSETRIFDSDYSAPIISLNYPGATSYINKNPLDLNFTATDAHTIVNCSLFLDGLLNQTIYNVVSSAVTNFTFVNFTQGFHGWNVSCYDSFGLRGYSANRNFTYDTSSPSVYLNLSSGAIFNGTTPVLNYTADDNIDSNLTCNITVNSVVVDSNIPSGNNTLISRTVSLLDGFKQWNVTCWDDAGNANTSETRIFQVVGGPLVQLQTPANGTVNNGSNLTFKYFAQDGNGILNCSLYINQIWNQTNSSISNGANNTFHINDLSEGIYNWSVSCYDTNSYSGNSNTWQLISDRSKPSITLNAPSIGLVITSVPIYFNLTFNDTYSPNATCNLTIDNVVSSSNQNFIAYRNNLTARSQTVTNGFHYWNVTCVDPGGNFNTSYTWNFTVNVTFPVNLTVIADKSQYQEGEIALINVSTRNETLGGVAANITLDYIYTNTTYTDMPWWNTSWTYRKPIILNQTNNTLITNKALLVNVTVPYGTITDCEELRVISDSEIALVESGVINGDDVTYCYIYFIGSVSANAVNENNYHVYYGNPDATYSSLSTGISGSYIFRNLFFDGFDGPAISSNWTANSGWDGSTDDPLSGDHAHVDGTVSNSNITLASSLNLSSYDIINISFTWGIDGGWDTGPPLDYLRYDYTNNSGSSWAQIGTLDGGSGAITQTLTATLNSSYKVNGFNIKFRATTDNNNEDGGFDDFNVTAYYEIQSSVTSGVGSQQLHIQRITSQTNSTGQYNTTFTTNERTYGNYSAAAYAFPPNTNLRHGWGYDWFEIISDQFGPVITLLYPQNLSTLRSSNITFNYTAVDYANNVQNCSLYINGAFNQTNTTINESITNSFTAYFSEGTYTWYVSCIDTLGSSSNSSIYNLSIDDTLPSVNAIAPNATTQPSGTVAFTFNVTDNIDTLILCNISVDNYNYSTLFNTSSGLNSTNIQNITDGLHYWNMTCWDNAGNNATSDTLNFTTATIPIVTLDNPFDEYGLNSTNITLYYNLSSIDVANCSLILNDDYNQTVNASEIAYKVNDGINNFTLQSMNYGIYNWTVICFDINNFNGTDAIRVFHLDNDMPNITLIYPSNNQTIYSKNINFTFSVTDIDDVLTCNLSIDGLINKTNINASSNKTTGVYVTGLSVIEHNWSVACTDNAGFTAISSTYNFTIDSSVNVVPISPADNYTTNIGSLNFSYIPSSPADFDLGFCDLYINGSVYSTHVALTSGVQDTFTETGFGTGSYTWYVNCTDSVGENNLSATRAFVIDTTSPNVISYYPDGHSFISSAVFFNWTATDNYDTNMTCTIRVNNTVKSPSIASLNNTLTNATYTGISDGMLFWNVTCVDDAGNSGVSALKNFTIQEPPNVTLNTPANNNRAKNQNITFYYTPTDNSGNISSCSIILDGSINQTNSTLLPSGTQRNFVINSMPAGYHNWSINCTDPSGNVGTSLNYTFYIDLFAPDITLDRPSEGDFLNNNDVFFNWTATDYNGTSINCSIYADGIYKNSTLRTSGSSFNVTVFNLTDGLHNWSVNCRDDLNNNVTSEIRNFTINQPDLFINISKIVFNNTNPNENQTINITANVSNIGGVPATNAFVEFWDGDPGVGSYIGNYTATVGTNSSIIFWTLWNITKGYHTVYVNVDPYNVISELNETNNNATKNISLLLSNIYSPPNGSMYVNPNVSINFTLQDFTNGLINYSVFVDNVFNGQNGSVTDNVSSNITVILTQGTHTIKIQATDALGRKKNSTALYIIIDYMAPYPVINTANQTWYNYGTPTINISATDDRVINISYRIYVNGSIDSLGNISNGTSALINLSSLQNGSYIVIMEAWDDLNNTRNSTPKIIYVDTVNPEPLITTLNNSWFNSSNPLIYFNITDNMATIFNYTFFVNNSYNVNGNITNISGYKNLQNLSNGTYVIVLEAVDQAGNRKNSTMITINIDLVRPNIILNYPDNQINITNNYIELNFTPYDNMAQYLICNLTLDSVDIASSLNASAGQIQNVTATNLVGGYHYWNVTCYDHAGNANTSLTYSFFVLMPDIEVLSSRIYFNESSPLENSSINITAEIRNIGSNSAPNFIVQFFANNPFANGIQINGNITLNLSMNESKNISVIYTIPIGTNSFFVLADAPTTTNGSVIESNESNNAANKSLAVSQWQYILGYELGALRMYNPSYNILFEWNVTNTTGSHVFAADIDSSITWFNLTAATRDTEENFAGTDLYKIDQALGDENNTDSINRTYMSDNFPVQLENITVFNRQIKNVPVYNSTNNDNFLTGILWDSGDGGSSYNKSQDIVFVTHINKNATGYNNSYDFEMRLPAKLRQYKAGVNMVSLYAELN